MTSMSAMKRALATAIEQAGGPRRLAKELGISRPAVAQWTICPHERVPAVSKLSGVPRHKLRPDLYEKPR